MLLRWTSLLTRFMNKTLDFTASPHPSEPSSKNDQLRIFFSPASSLKCVRAKSKLTYGRNCFRSLLPRQYLTRYFISQLSCHSTNFHLCHRCWARFCELRLKIQFREIDLCSFLWRWCFSLFFSQLFSLLPSKMRYVEPRSTHEPVSAHPNWFVTSFFTLNKFLFCLSCKWIYILEMSSLKLSSRSHQTAQQPRKPSLVPVTASRECNNCSPLLSLQHKVTSDI